MTIRLTSIAFGILFFVQPITAQKNEFSIGVGPSVGIPLNFNEGYKTGFGGGARAYYGVTKEGAILLNINSLSFASKFTGGSAANLTSVKAGYRTFFNTPKLFIYADAGLIFKSGNTGQTGSDFGVGGGLGYSIPIGQNSHIDIAPSFNIVFQDVINRTWLDLHFAYRFNLSRR
jgi:hypothetical protein